MINRDTVPLDNARGALPKAKCLLKKRLCNVASRTHPNGCRLQTKLGQLDEAEKTLSSLKDNQDAADQVFKACLHVASCGWGWWGRRRWLQQRALRDVRFYW
jgi:hypothetical protein